ncbi:MAG: hypothetical protein R2867_12090 [Caldilineaceae bacterium]
MTRIHNSTYEGLVNRSRGQLTTVSSADYTKSLFYNDRGLLRRDTVLISGGPSATTRYGYDSYLRPSTTTYQDNEVVTVSYNSIGKPNKFDIQQRWDIGQRQQKYRQCDGWCVV